MASYVAVAPPSRELEETVFARDGFTFWAFLLPAAWFLIHRMWIEAALAFAATLLLGSLDALGDPFHAFGGPLLSLLFGLLIGLEAPSLRLWALRRRGWAEMGVVEAVNAEEAAVRFFVDAQERAEADEAAGQMAPPPAVPGFGRGAVPALGFLDYRGGA